METYSVSTTERAGKIPEYASNMNASTDSFRYGLDLLPPFLGCDVM